jgi:hypothetical protein
LFIPKLSHSSMVVLIERFARHNKLFFDYNNGPPSLWDYFFLVIWFTFGFCSKLCEIVQTMVATLYLHLFTSSTPQFMPKPIVQQLETLNCQNPIVAIVAIEPINYLLFGFTNVIVVDHIFPMLSLNPSMLWCLYRCALE